MKYYSLDEVKEHNKLGDVWVINDGFVYDVSKFQETHPGGIEKLVQYAGQDVTEVMKSTKEHKHSKIAYNLINNYKIGKVESDLAGAQGDGLRQRKGFFTDYEDQAAFLKDYEKDTLVDWNKPIFWQVGALGDKYMDWVHSPVEKNIRLFYSDFCEFFSKCPWYVIPIVWVPLMILMLWRSYVNLSSGDAKLFGTIGLDMPLTTNIIIPVFLFGSFFWTFVEYAIHRWLFHSTPPANWPFLITIHFLMHGQHHKDPLNRMRLVFPPVPASSIAIPLGIFMFIVLPIGLSQVMLAGVILGYICYDMTHYYVHHGTPSLQRFKNIKRYHIRHHFEDVNKGFGITTTFWDHPFGTLLPEEQE